MTAPMSIDDLLRQHLVARRTLPSDAAERYYCPRTKRTLWIEAERPSERSSREARRYLVDDGDGTRIFYSGDDFEVAMTRLLSYGKPQRNRDTDDPPASVHVLRQDRLRGRDLQAGSRGEARIAIAARLS